MRSVKSCLKLGVLYSQGGLRGLQTGCVVRQQAAIKAEYFGQEQMSIKKTAKRIIDEDINPYVDQCEEKGIYPAHTVFKKLGSAGMLGMNKPVDY